MIVILNSLDTEKKRHESRFLEAPFVRMLRMRSANLKSQLLFNFFWKWLLKYIEYKEDMNLSQFGDFPRP